MKKYLFLFITLVLCAACEKDDDQVIREITITPLPPIIVSGSSSGILHNESGQRLSDVTIEIDNGDNFSSPDGVYYATYQDVNQLGTAVHLMYDDASYTRSFLPLENQNTVVDFGIYSNPETLTISAETPVDWTIDPALSLQITSPLYRRNGSTISGTIQWEGYALNMQNKFHRNCLSGVLRGSDLNGDPAYLHPSLAFNISAQENNIDVTWEGVVEIDQFIPEDAQVFKFNRETLGYDYYGTIDSNSDASQITLTENGEYIIAQAYPLTLLKGTLKTNTEYPVSSTIGLSINGQHLPHACRADGGYILLAAGQNDVALVLENNCGTVVASIAESLENKAIHIRDVVLSEKETSVIQATPVDCAFQAIPDGLIVYTQDNKSCITQTDNGIIHTLLCSDDPITIYSVDPTDFTTSTAHSFTADNINRTGFHPACDGAENGYFFMSFDRTDFTVFDDIIANTENGRTRISLQNEDNELLDFDIWFDQQEIGDRNDTELNIRFTDISSTSQYAMNCSTSTLGCGFTDFIVTHYEEQGGWIRILFEGEFFMRTRDPSLAITRTTVGQILTRRNF